eukprot:GEMP01001713.1.p1 GENE.GEMP01001713.1~~GEMP01001713.1.p1  ORF type:complete len:1272 (+),score=315.58 GEMP01001713.1:236-4051(+)
MTIGDFEEVEDNDKKGSKMEVRCKLEEKSEVPPPGFFSIFEFIDNQDKVELSIGTIAAMIHGTTVPLTIYVFGRLIDEFRSPAGLIGEAPGLILQIVYISIVAMACSCAWATLFKRVATRTTQRMRGEYFRHVLLHDVAWFDACNALELPTQIQEDPLKVDTALGNQLGSCVQMISQFVAGLILALICGTQLALVMLAGLPLIALSCYFLARAVIKLNATNASWYQEAGAVAEETLGAMKTVSSFGEEQREIDRYGGLLEGVRRRGRAFGWIQGASIGGFWCTQYLLYALGMWYSAILVGEGRPNSWTGEPWSAGNVLTTFFSSFLGVLGLGLSLPYIPISIDARFAMQRYYSVAKNQKYMSNGDDTLSNSGGMSISMDDVYFAYPAKPSVNVLQGVSLHIVEGSKAAFVGESGCGKSTAMQLLLRFYDPLVGCVKINGRDVRALDLGHFRRRVALVSQEPVLFATSVRRNIAYGLPHMPTDDEFYRALSAARVDFLEKIDGGLDGFVGTAGNSTLSGGQKQRLAIARALIRQPQLLLLDEATSALDNISEREVQQTIDELGTSWVATLTIISIAHRLSAVRGSDKIFFFKRGIIAEEGTHDELCAREGRYYAMMRSQVEVKSAVEDPTIHKMLSKSASHVSGGTRTMSTARSDEQVIEEKQTLEKRKRYQPSLRRLFTMTGKANRLTPAALLVSLINGARSPMNGLLFGAVLASLSGRNIKEAVNPMALLFLVLAVVAFVLQLLQTSTYYIISQRLVKNVRAISYEHILRQDMSFFDDPRYFSGSLTAFLSVSAHRVSNVTGENLGTMITVVATLLISCIVSLVSKWKVALVLMACIPVIVLSFVLQSKMKWSGNGACGGEDDNGEVIVSETIQDVRTVKSLGGVDVAFRRYMDTTRKAFEAQIRSALTAGLFFGISNGIIFLAYALGFWWGSWVICDEASHKCNSSTLTPSEFTDHIDQLRAFTTAVFTFMIGLGGIGSVATFAPDAQKAREAAFDLFAILDRRSASDPLSDEGVAPPTGAADTITFEDVTFSYPGKMSSAHVRILNCVSFEVEPNTSIAFCGPSGSGKSTIVAMLQRFYTPQQGRILVGATPLHDINLRAWRQQIGYVGQEPILFDMSLRDNIKYGSTSASDEQVKKAAQTAKIDFVGENKQINWDDRVGPRGSRLSGGQKQRVAIARALVRDPRYLLLDEATSALDSQSEHQIQQALDDAAHGRTTLVVAHRLSTIVKCDKIVVLVNGMVREQGTHTELMNKKKLYYALQLASSGAN